MTKNKFYYVMFFVMLIVGIYINPMNVLAYRFNDFYISLTLIYGGLFMASNMLWAHEIVHLLTINHFNITIFFVGLILSICISTLLLRRQLFVDDRQWLKRMISHHSTALTTSNNIYSKTNNTAVKELAKKIIITQEEEITLMKKILSSL